MFDITQECSRCRGTGIGRVVTGPNTTGEEDPCTKCGGDGQVAIMHVYSTNVLESYQVLEAIDTTEYNALTDTQKDGVKILLSCGFVDLNVGKAGRVRFLAWFGAESTTVANITELLG